MRSVSFAKSNQGNLLLSFFASTIIYLTGLLIADPDNFFESLGPDQFCHHVYRLFRAIEVDHGVRVRIIFPSNRIADPVGSISDPY